MIYLDNAATTKPCFASENAYAEATASYGNPSSVHGYGRRAMEYLFNAKKIIAECINANWREIYFTSSGTESDNWAILGVSQLFEGSHIITTEIEHSAVLEPCRALEQDGYEVTYIKPNKDGVIKPADIENAIQPNTKLVSVMWANNEMGTIQPIKKIGAMCKKYKILFHVDATQAMATEKIDVQACNIDLLTFSSHKIYAPVGLGVLYVREGTKIGALNLGGGQQRGYVAGTENYPLAYATAKALLFCQNNLNYHNKKIMDMRNHFVERVLSEIPDTELVGGKRNRLVGNANIHIKGCESESVVLSLDLGGVCASAGSACHAGSSVPSHTIISIGHSPEYANSCVRFTFGAYNTMEEVDKAVDILKGVVKEIREN